MKIHQCKVLTSACTQPGLRRHLGLSKWLQVALINHLNTTCAELWHIQQHSTTLKCFLQVKMSRTRKQTNVRYSNIFDSWNHHWPWRGFKLAAGIEQFKIILPCQMSVMLSNNTSHHLAKLQSHFINKEETRGNWYVNRQPWNLSFFKKTPDQTLVGLDN